MDIFGFSSIIAVRISKNILNFWKLLDTPPLFLSPYVKFRGASPPQTPLPSVRFGKTKNERHAAWERFSPRLVAQNRSPENAPNHFKVFLKLFWSPTGAPELCTSKKKNQLKWTPKSAQGDRTKHSFSICFCICYSSASTW